MTRVNLLLHFIVDGSKTNGYVANSVDPDQMMQCVTSDLSLHLLHWPFCLYTYSKCV